MQNSAKTPTPTPTTGLPTDDDRLWPAELAAVRLAEDLARRGPEAAIGAPFAALLRLSRVRARITQVELAGLLGVAGNTVARWEQGQFEPPRQADLPPTQEQILASLSQLISHRRPPNSQPCQAFCPGKWPQKRLSDTTRAVIGL